jgi:hypothetical protein
MLLDKKTEKKQKKKQKKSVSVIFFTIGHFSLEGVFTIEKIDK